MKCVDPQSTKEDAELFCDEAEKHFDLADKARNADIRTHHVAVAKACVRVYVQKMEELGVKIC